MGMNMSQKRKREEEGEEDYDNEERESNVSTEAAGVAAEVIEVAEAAEIAEGVTEDKWIPQDIGSRRLKSYVQQKMKQSVQRMAVCDAITAVQYACSGDCDMDDSSALLAAAARSLWDQFDRDGYLYLPGVLCREEILKAKDSVESSLVSMKLLSEDRNTALSSNGWTVDTMSGGIISGQDDYGGNGSAEVERQWKALCTAQAVQTVLQGDCNRTIRQILSLLSAGRQQAIASSSDYKCTSGLYHPHHTWLRVKAPSEYTPEHADIFYFKVCILLCFCYASVVS
jgi:NTP pyrophosphatase (non-canonical NTP hydrolase)